MTLNFNPKDLLFLKSAFTNEGEVNDMPFILRWIELQKQKVGVKIEKIDFKDLKQWSFGNNFDILKHESGKFFSIAGIHVETNWGEVPFWEQPIINQPEIGYLGFITKEFNGVLHFLLQAKIEPGNINFLQLSPTLQATKSNYNQVHKGKKPLYLEFFQNAEPKNILLDQLQSEQGARFLKKRNRNIIIKVEEEIPVYDNFIWVTLLQIKELIKLNNLVNMDTRTVISGISYGNFQTDVISLLGFLGTKKSNDTVKATILQSALNAKNSLHSFDDIITFLTKMKSFYELHIEYKPLSKIENWILGKSEIYHEQQKYFKVIAVNVEIENREVVSWSQPMIEAVQEGLCAFVCKNMNGLLHFIVQAKLECGNFDIIELAPTVQCLTGNYRNTKEGSLPFLNYVLNAKQNQIIFDTMLSEEGGRFYREQNRNLIVIAGDEISDVLPENYMWMSLNQLFAFIKFNNFLNIQARSLLSAISFI